MSTNFYEILGVSKEATTEEIKKAYRKKALKCHPDRTKDLPDNARKLAEEEFKKINNAHETLSDLTRRQLYDREESIVFHDDKPRKKYTYQSGSIKFTRDGLNGRVKLSGARKSEFTVHNEDYKNQTLKITLELAKDSLEPMLQRLNELMETLNNRAFRLDSNNNPEIINSKYAAVSRKVTAMCYEIMFYMDALRDDVIDYNDMLHALRSGKKIIQEAQNDGEFERHRGFVRNCPILRELCACLDLMVNFFTFLDKKVGKILSGNKTPIFANMQEFKFGMFKPTPTSTARKVNELSTDLTWYIEKIEDEYKRAIP